VVARWFQLELAQKQLHTDMVGLEFIMPPPLIGGALSDDAV